MATGSYKPPITVLYPFCVLKCADELYICASIYRQISDIRRALVGNTIVDHSDVVGASPVGAVPTTSSFPT